MQQTRAVSLMLMLLCGQLAFAWGNWEKRPALDVLSPPPSKVSLTSSAVGDEELSYRIWSLRLQNAGDGFGRVTALKDYNYEHVESWLVRLSGLSPESSWMPSLASYYFALSQEPEDTRYIISYLEEYASRDPAKHWWWLAQAVYIARSKLKDMDLALRLSHKLKNIEGDIPVWARQLPAFIYEAKGDKDAALGIMLPLLENFDSLDEGEQNYVLYFITERMKAELPEMYQEIYEQREGARAAEKDK